MSTGAKLLGAKVFTRKQAIRMKDHRIAIQESLAYALSEARRLAGENLIENTTGTINPYAARKKQPSVSGKLTNRTSKLKKMLLFGTSGSNPLNSWGKSKGTNLYKEKKNIGLKGQVKSTSLGKGRRDTARVNETHKATYRVYIRSHPFLFNTSGGQPTETTQTLAVRFNWETGIRGQRRPIFKPILGQVKFSMVNQVKLKNSNIWSK